MKRKTTNKTDSAPQTKAFSIISPYSQVKWNTADAWQRFSGSLHSHSTYSDADIDLAAMVKENYALGRGFLAVSDHSVTGVEWNREPKRLLLYSYQKLTGKKVEHLTDEEFAAITDGSYNSRGEKMACVTGANELNNLSLTKNHVNGYFLPANVGNGYAGRENEAGYKSAVEFIERNGGLSHINHPGDWIGSNAYPQTVRNPKYISFFADLILRHAGCLGIEVLNERNGTTGYDRILWDNLLMYCLPFGKTVIGFANTDAHSLLNVDSSFSVFMMESNSVENIKKTMQSGSFFAVTKALRGNRIFEIGPTEDFDVRGKGLPYPVFSELTVDGHKITTRAENATELQWIANGRVIMKTPIGDKPVVLNLDEIAGAEDFLYVRAELKGEGGMCLSQAFIIDCGKKPLEFKKAIPPTDIKSRLKRYIRGSKLGCK